MIFGANENLTFTPTVQSAAYSAGNVMGGLQTVACFTAASIPSGIFDNFMIASKGGNTGAMTIYIFDTNPTASTFTDKSAISLNAADVGKLAFAPFILTPAVPQGATAAVAEYGVIRSLQNGDKPTTQNLYIAIVANATITPGTTTDIVCNIAVSRD